MKAFAFVIVGVLLGGGFTYEKMATPPQLDTTKQEVVMGHRIDSNGNFMLVTSK